MSARKKAPSADTVTRGFELELGPVTEWDRKVGRAVEVKPARRVAVRVTVDFEAIALQLAGRLAKSKSGKARGQKGAVVMTIVDAAACWPFPRQGSSS